MWQGFQGIGGQAGLPRAPAPRFVIPAPHFVMPAPHFVIPAPHFVIPAKAGIQRGGEGTGQSPVTSPQTPPVDPPNFNPIRISLKIPITSSNDPAETPKGREAGSD